MTTLAKLLWTFKCHDKEHDGTSPLKFKHLLTAREIFVLIFRFLFAFTHCTSGVEEGRGAEGGEMESNSLPPTNFSLSKKIFVRLYFPRNTKF